MTLTKPIPSRARADQLQVRPQVPLFVDFRRGVADAISGQRPDFARASTATVTGSNGVTYTVPANVPALTWLGNDGLGVFGDGNLQYDISEDLYYPALGAQSLQVAFDGRLPVSGLGTLWHIGSASTGALLALELVGDGVRVRYRNSAAQESTADLFGLPRGERVYLVAQLVAQPGDEFRARLVGTFDLFTWSQSDLGASVAADPAWSSGLVSVLSRQGAEIAAGHCHRLYVQYGVADVDALAWGWEEGDVDPSFLGFVENGQISLQYGVSGNIFLTDQGTYISLDASSPPDFEAVSPGGLASPYIYLEAV